VVGAGGCTFTMVIGFLWYSPLLFARPWMILMGYDPDDKSKLDEMRKGAGKNYAIAFIASLTSALVLGKLIELRPRSPLHGTWIAFAVWLGFVSTVQLTDALFSKRPFKLYAIKTAYQLVCYLVMGTILAAWAS
jgi:Protein of unknown function (DUF1761)